MQTIRILILLLMTLPFSALAQRVEFQKLFAEEVRCAGNATTSCEFIRSQVHVALGEVLSEEELANAKLRMSSLRNFESATQASVLIAGESGTGKELVANTIHANSARKDGAFIKVNCSAIPDTLIESELFGHERGAFTGATAARRGVFEAAHRGTVFLDEVADLSLSAQAKILRLLQSGDLQKLGSDRTLHVDVRILSATHKDLRQAVAAGRFREDLFYRLNVVPLRVPALRERAEDVPLLVAFLLKQLCVKNNVRAKTLDEDVLIELKRYTWPGNVRELGNVIERMLIMSGERITVADLPEEIFEAATETSAASTLKQFRDQAERDFILNILRKHGGNISQSAVELGVRRTYLHRRIAQLGITKRDYFG